MEATKLARPVPGTVTTRVTSIPVCALCHCVIDSDTDMCDYECDYDGDHADPKTYFYAVYEVSEKFIRDEEPSGRESGPTECDPEDHN